MTTTASTMPINCVGLGRMPRPPFQKRKCITTFLTHGNGWTTTTTTTRETGGIEVTADPTAFSDIWSTEAFGMVDATFPLGGLLLDPGLYSLEDLLE